MQYAAKPFTPPTHMGGCILEEDSRRLYVLRVAIWRMAVQHRLGDVAINREIALQRVIENGPEKKGGNCRRDDPAQMIFSQNACDECSR